MRKAPPENRAPEAREAPAEKRPWTKGGASPNPGGRPKAVAELLAIARASVPRALDFAAALLGDEEQDARTRLDAAKLLLAYGLGKPPSVAADEAGELSRPLVGIDAAQLLEIMRAGANAATDEREAPEH